MYLMQVIGYSDTDVAEYIYSRKPQLDVLVNYLCKDLTKACSKKPPPVPKVHFPAQGHVIYLAILFRVNFMKNSATLILDLE